MQKDFRALLVLLNEHEADFMIIGDYALAFHGAPRFTGDIDIYVRPDHDKKGVKLKTCKIQLKRVKNGLDPLT